MFPWWKSSLQGTLAGGFICYACVGGLGFWVVKDQTKTSLKKKKTVVLGSLRCNLRFSPKRKSLLSFLALALADWILKCCCCNAVCLELGLSCLTLEAGPPTCPPELFHRDWLNLNYAEERLLFLLLHSEVLRKAYRTSEKETFLRISSAAMKYPAFWGTNHPSTLRVVGDEVILFQESKGWLGAFASSGGGLSLIELFFLIFHSAVNTKTTLTSKRVRFRGLIYWLLLFSNVSNNGPEPLV